ncbi:ECF transporter S component [Blautia sp. MSJ-19]|uniref:ECF transporter S component n=1 Tax=Blautia sp. MSJ-19 TaxID=2841517 RepID=UPI001C0ED906|nr:ECF transporter S component [Blautia sp. MSJ-19]MBU5479729.1 ECF transporter S component [Blautia sp. MSJ-19]
MLNEQELDQFLDEFMDTEKRTALTMPEQKKKKHKKEMVTEEYTLPSDGLIIRQMKKEGTVSKRTWAAMFLLLLVVPPVLFFSVKVFHGRKYLLCSLIVVIAAMLPFFMMFEGRKPKAREIMVISVLAAIGVAGRAAFFMVPSFKPVAAIVILTGISFGGEAGFLVGCMIMLLSNMFMGQGPWTPWQMFAFGIIGYLAGILYQCGILKAKKTQLCIFGFLSVFLIYGGIMNPAGILMSYGYITKSTLIAYYISGAPVDLVHALSTVFFLWVLSRPLLEKLERIKVKYGLIEKNA